MGWRDVLAVAGFLFGSGAFVTVLRMWLGHRDAHHDIARRLAEGHREFKELRDEIRGYKVEVRTELMTYRELEDRRHNQLDDTVETMDARTHSLVAGVREIMVSLGLRSPGQSINGEKD